MRGCGGIQVELLTLKMAPSFYILHLLWPQTIDSSIEKQIIHSLPDSLVLQSIYGKVEGSKHFKYELKGFLCSENFHCVAFYKEEKQWSLYDDARVLALADGLSIQENLQRPLLVFYKKTEDI